MFHNFDWAGFAVFVTAAAGAVVTVGTFIRQGKMQRQQQAMKDVTEAHTAQLTEIKDAVAASKDQP